MVVADAYLAARLLGAGGRMLAAVEQADDTFIFFADPDGALGRLAEQFDQLEGEAAGFEFGWWVGEAGDRIRALLDDGPAMKLDPSAPRIGDACDVQHGHGAVVEAVSMAGGRWTAVLVRILGGCTANERFWIDREKWARLVRVSPGRPEGRGATQPGRSTPRPRGAK